MQETLFRRRAIGGASVVVAIVLWEAVVRLLAVPPTVLPGPIEVVRRLWRMFTHESLMTHISTTLSEIAVGVLIGLVVGIVMAFAMSRSRVLEKVFTPVLVAVQVAPKIALAPLFVLWFGLGVPSKIWLVALVTYFPVLINVLTLIKGVDRNLLDLGTVLGMSKLQRFRKIEVPSVLPGLLTGMRLGSLAGVTAAVIGELIGSRGGLGYVVIRSQENSDVPQGIAALLLLSLIGLVLWTGIGAAARYAENRFAPG
jgi:NitT/TauT family transport system permease protein